MFKKTKNKRTKELLFTYRILAGTTRNFPVTPENFSKNGIIRLFGYFTLTPCMKSREIPPNYLDHTLFRILNISNPKNSNENEKN